MFRFRGRDEKEVIGKGRKGEGDRGKSIGDRRRGLGDEGAGNGERGSNCSDSVGWQRMSSHLGVGRVPVTLVQWLPREQGAAARGGPMRHPGRRAATAAVDAAAAVPRGGTHRTRRSRSRAYSRRSRAHRSCNRTHGRARRSRVTSSHSRAHRSRSRTRSGAFSTHSRF